MQYAAAVVCMFTYMYTYDSISKELTTHHCSTSYVIHTHFYALI